VTERLAWVAGQLREFARRVQEQRQRSEQIIAQQTTRRSTELERLDRTISNHVEQLDHLKRDMSRLRKAFRSHALRTERLMPPQLTDRLGVVKRLERIAASGRPIIAGPWTGEVGYEILYWAPFIRWFVRQYQVDPDRIRVVSRGGPQSWYQGAGDHYVDALSYFSPDEFRERAAVRAWMKQDRVTMLDREILRRSRASLGTGPFSMLHPSLMFRSFKGFWGGRLSINELLQTSAHVRLTPPQNPAGLPSRYIAVRFYFRTSFPDTPENRQVVTQALAALTDVSDVVILNPGFRIDDHHDHVAERGGRIHTIDHLLTPERNLEVQTAVIGNADGFVGSYGGFSYLAPLLGVNSLAFFSAPTFKHSHLELAEHVFSQVGGGKLTVVNTEHRDLLTGLLAGAPAGEVPA
jgi:hypothetical protein